MALSDDVNGEITAAEEELRKQLSLLKKALSTLARSKPKLTKTTWPIRDLRKLVTDLNNQILPVTHSVITPLVMTLKQKLDAAESEFEKAFVIELTREAQQSKISCGQLSGVRFLGPFELQIDFAGESAGLSYAKQPASSSLPLDAKVIVQCALKLASELLGTHLDPAKLAAEFEEAHRVALIRDKKSTDGQETRSMLPELFREMHYLRQDRGRILSVKTFREYTLSRFVVELKTLVQSEFNLESPKRFRLETAVIENTKNAKKSVFFPTDLKVGYGEGTYFQALVLVNEGR